LKQASSKAGLVLSTLIAAAIVNNVLKGLLRRRGKDYGMIGRD
jgi:hypothetical protein